MNAKWSPTIVTMFASADCFGDLTFFDYEKLTD